MQIYNCEINNKMSYKIDFFCLLPNSHIEVNAILWITQTYPK